MGKLFLGPRISLSMWKIHPSRPALSHPSPQAGLNTFSMTRPQHLIPCGPTLRHFCEYKEALLVIMRIQQEWSGLSRTNQNMWSSHISHLFRGCSLPSIIIYLLAVSHTRLWILKDKFTFVTPAPHTYCRCLIMLIKGMNNHFRVETWDPRAGVEQGARRIPNSGDSKPPSCSWYPGPFPLCMDVWPMTAPVPTPGSPVS